MKPLLRFFCVGVAMALPSFVHAEDAGWLRDQLRQTTVDLRRLQDENSALQVRLANAEKSGQPASDAGAVVAKARSESRREIVRLQAELAAATAQQEELRRQLAEATTQATAATREAGAARQREAVVVQQAQVCAQDNGELAAISTELLQRYRDRGVWDALREAEPLTGIQRARHESLVEKYRAAIVDAAPAGNR